MSVKAVRFMIIYHRIVSTDSAEPPEYADARKTFVDALTTRASGRMHLSRGRAHNRAFFERNATTPIPPPPDVPVWWHEGQEAARRRVDPELDRACADLEARLVARNPAFVRREGENCFYDFSRSLDLVDEWTAAQDAGEARHIARAPPLAVKPGDFVEISGRTMRIRNVDVLERRASIDFLDGRGQVIGGDSSVPAENLVPMTTPPTFTDPTLPEGDGLTRARAVKAELGELLAKAGLDKD